MIIRDIFFGDDRTATDFHVKTNKDNVHDLKSFDNFKDAKEEFFNQSRKEIMTKEEAFDKIKEAAEFVEECGFDGKEMIRAISDILEVVRSVED